MDNVDRIVKQLEAINNTLEYVVQKKNSNDQVEGCLGWLLAIGLVAILIVTKTWPIVFQAIFKH